MADRVVFTSGSADRIARVVRVVEAGNRDAAALPTSPRFGGGQAAKIFRICTFTGAWPVNTSKTVTFKNQTTAPNTASAVNLFFPISIGPTAETDCAIAKEGTSWFLIDVPLQTATAVFVTGTATQSLIVSAITATASFISGTTSTASAVSDVTLSASLDTNDCTITIGKTLATQSFTVFSVGEPQTHVFVTSTSTATAVIITETATATYLKLSW